jgi:hypothetical protein
LKKVAARRIWQPGSPGFANGYFIASDAAAHGDGVRCALPTEKAPFSR